MFFIDYSVISAPNLFKIRVKVRFLY